jgi:hypothetical protein
MRPAASFGSYRFASEKADPKGAQASAFRASERGVEPEKAWLAATLTVGHPLLAPQTCSLKEQALLFASRRDSLKAPRF